MLQAIQTKPLAHCTIEGPTLPYLPGSSLRVHSVTCNPQAGRARPSAWRRQNSSESTAAHQPGMIASPGCSPWACRGLLGVISHPIGRAEAPVFVRVGCLELCAFGPLCRGASRARARALLLRACCCRGRVRPSTVPGGAHLVPYQILAVHSRRPV